jgi:polar amino acid transport system substrate-binding protein
MPEELYKQLKSASKKMKHSILSPLKIDDKVYGVLSLDIPAESTESFTDIDVQLVDYFSKIISAFYQVKKYIKLQGIFLKNIVLALVNALEAYDIYTRGHSERVALYATQIAEKMGLDKETIRKIYWASLVHDIGKLNIPPEILNKPSKLTKEEYEIIKQHPIKGYQILKELEGLSNIAEIVKYHHERWDGKGYPEGLKGEEIPLEARIIAVADSYDAMTTERPYRKALTKEEAIKELLKNAGTQFDPKVVEVFVQILERKAEIVVKV